MFRFAATVELTHNMYMAGLLLIAIAVLIASGLVLLRKPENTAYSAHQIALLAVSGLLVVRQGFLFATVLGGEPQTGAGLIAEALMLCGAIAILILALKLPLEKSARVPAVDSAALSREAQLRGAIENTPDPIFVKDVEGRYVLVNAASLKEFGYPQVNPIGKRDDELWDARCAANFIESDRKVLTGETVVVEQLIQRNNGAFVFLTTKSPLRAADGRVVGIVGVAHDITARKKAESELIELEIALENAIPGIARVGFDGRYRAVNPAFAQMLGYTSQELVGRRVEDTTHPDDLLLFSELRDKADRDGRAEAQYRGLRADGSAIFQHIFLVKPRGSSIDGIFCFMRDISDRRRQEEESLRTQKFEAVGKLAGHLARDLSNELTTILGSLDQVSIRLKSAIHADDPSWRAIENLNRAANEAANIARKLAVFGGPSQMSARRFELVSAVKSLEPMMRRIVGDSVHLAIESADTSIMIEFEPAQFETILSQLCANARDAMPQGGEVRVAIEKVVPERLTMAAHSLHHTSAPRAVVRVIDTGVGMSDEVMRRLFEPFFTTKPLGRGLGLGLATVQNSVTRYGGSIEVSSTLGRGTEIRLLLPLVDDPPPAAHRISEVAADTRSSSLPAAILVCENDVAISTTIEKTLLEMGCRVCLAKTGREALAIVRQPNSGIDVLLTERVLPDMGGRQLADLVCRLKPHTQVIFLSVAGDDELTDSGYIDLSIKTLQKPFQPADLIQFVQAALAGRIINHPANS